MSVAICAHPGRLFKLLLGFVPPLRTVLDPHTAFTWFGDKAVKAGPWPLATDDTDTSSSRITADFENDLATMMMWCVCVNEQEPSAALALKCAFEGCSIHTSSIDDNGPAPVCGTAIRDKLAQSLLDLCLCL